MKLTAISALLLTLLGCASGAGGIGRPDIEVLRLSVPRANPGAQFSVLVTLSIRNHSSEVMTVRRVDLSSAGIGPFDVGPSTENFELRIEPNASGLLEVWAQARPGQSDVGGEEGTLLLRGVVYYDDATGSHRAVFSQRTATTVAPARARE